MTELLNLGHLYVSDFLSKNEKPRTDPVEMKMIYDYDMGCPRLESVADKNFMYGRYWYRSGINSTMNNELKSIVESITSIKKNKKENVWLDIACNDGTLLSFVPNNFIKIGIDPADDSFIKESSKHANIIVQDYFSANIYNDSIDKKADVITVIAMFYDLENPDIFLSDIYSIMNDDGLLVIQMSYTPLMIEQMAFDNICHEHVYYYSLESINKLLNKNGFRIVDCQLNDVNGGSFRIYATKNILDITKFATQPYRDVCQFRINSLISYEKTMKYNSIDIWYDFKNKINSLKEKTFNFIMNEVKNGKVVWGYGASTKGNTLLQYFNLDASLISGIAERSPYKYGLYTIGTNIPIYSEIEMRNTNPDYLLILPWHFINEFINREMEYLLNGGKFIIPCPEFKIIGIEDI